MSGHVIFAHENGDCMPADVFTKMFGDKAKWVSARQLINIILPEELKKLIGDNINIIVWRNPELSMSVPVRPDGKFSTPLIDELKAQGSITDAEYQKLRARLI